MVSRGGIYWIELDKRRPCVVVSAKEVLSIDIWQTHVVPLTSNLDRANIAGNVFLDSHLTGLAKDSVAVPIGLELIDRVLLKTKSGHLPGILIQDIESGISKILGL